MSYIRETSAGYLTNWAARLFARAIERRLAGGAPAGLMASPARRRHHLIQKSCALGGVAGLPAFGPCLGAMSTGWVV